MRASVLPLLSCRGLFFIQALISSRQEVRQVEAAEGEAAVIKLGVHFIARNIVCVIYLMCQVHKRRLYLL